MLSPFLFTLFSHGYVSGDQPVRLITFSDDATLIGCIEYADTTAYRVEVQRMVGCCGKNNLVLNVSKTCEMTVDFRKHKNQCFFNFDSSACRSRDIQLLVTEILSVLVTLFVFKNRYK